MTANTFKKGAWTKDEDDRLRAVLQSLPKSDGSCRWSEVSVKIPGRSAKQCRERWCYNLDPTIKKGPWTPKEDEILIKAQQDLGNRWAQIAHQLPGRTENSVKTRHKSIMRAKKRAWTDEEDQLIMSMHAEIGCRWDKIAERLPLRTKNAVKTRYRLLVRGLHEETPAQGSPEQVLSKLKLNEPQPSNVLPPSGGLPSPTSVAAMPFSESKPSRKRLASTVKLESNVAPKRIATRTNKRRAVANKPKTRIQMQNIVKSEPVADAGLNFAEEDPSAFLLEPVENVFPMHSNPVFSTELQEDDVLPFLESIEFLDAPVPKMQPVHEKYQPPQPNFVPYAEIPQVKTASPEYFINARAKDLDSFNAWNDHTNYPLFSNNMAELLPLIG